MQDTGEATTDVAAYRYDGLGQRTAKTLADDTRFDYYYNGQWQVLEVRRTPSGQQAQVYEQYLWDPAYVDTPILRWRDADPNVSGLEELAYYTADANHNITALVDASGQVAERYVYDAYGAVTILSGDWTTVHTASVLDNDRLHSGQERDAETGLDNSRYRFYACWLGVFVERDPARDGMNLYQYCGGRPTSTTDPTGLSPEGQPGILVLPGGGTIEIGELLPTLGVAQREAVRRQLQEEVANPYTPLGRAALGEAARDRMAEDAALRAGQTALTDRPTPSYEPPKRLSLWGEAGDLLTWTLSVCWVGSPWWLERQANGLLGVWQGLESQAFHLMEQQHLKWWQAGTATVFSFDRIPLVANLWYAFADEQPHYDGDPGSRLHWTKTTWEDTGLRLSGALFDAGSVGLGLGSIKPSSLATATTSRAGRGFGGNAIVDRIAAEAEGALSQANRIVEAGCGKTTWARIYRRVYGSGGRFEELARRQALHDEAKLLMEKNYYVTQARAAGCPVLFNKGSVIGVRGPGGGLRRPDIQVGSPLGKWAAIDWTTEGEAGKVLRFGPPVELPWAIPVTIQ